MLPPLRFGLEQLGEKPFFTLSTRGTAAQVSLQLRDQEENLGA